MRHNSIIKPGGFKIQLSGFHIYKVSTNIELQYNIILSTDFHQDHKNEMLKWDKVKTLLEYIKVFSNFISENNYAKKYSYDAVILLTGRGDHFKELKKRPTGFAYKGNICKE